MRIPHFATAAITLLLMVGAPTPGTAGTSQQSSGADVDAVVMAMDATGDALRAGDNEAFLSMYVEDVFFMPPNSAPAAGKEAMRAGMSLDGPLAWAETYDEVMVHGDWAHVVGAWTIGDEVAGKAIYILSRQDDGTWKIAREFWNTDAAPEEAQ